MTHPEYIDLRLASRKCSHAELEVVHLRNQRMSWTHIAELVGKSRGTVRSLWGDANRKVNGGYVPATRRLSKEERDLERAMMAADPDTLRGLRGIPTVGLSKPGAGIVPGKPTRSGKDAA